MKKVLAMVLAVLMLVSVLCVGTAATVSADEAAAAFVVDSASASAGDTVSVAVRIQNNPGIVGLRVNVGYDASVLTPTAAVEQDLAGVSFGPLTANPLSVLWVDAIHPNVTDDCAVALLTFQVAEDAVAGTYPLTLSLEDSADIFGADESTGALYEVPFATINGAVTVVDYTIGDVNSDGKINVRDLGMLQQRLNGWDVTIHEAAADVTGDGKLNVRDLGILQQYLNGWDVQLGGGTQPQPPVDPEPPVEDDDVLTVEEAIALGSSMEHNVYTEEKYYVTGVITEVYNTMYGNMKIGDDAGNILTIYGTYSADGETRYDALDVKPVAGDTVTIYGILGQYNGTPQIKNGWITEHIPGEGGGDLPVDPPVDGGSLTVEEAIALGSSMAHNTYTTEKYSVTGVITEVYNTQYGNMRLTDDAGNILTIYGTWSADGETRYDALEVKPVAGDTVTIYGIVGQYNDTPQIKNGWIIEHIPGEGGGDDPDPQPPVEGGAVLEFTDKANRVSYSTEEQVWAQNGITVTNNKGASTSNVGDYGGEGYAARFYKSSNLLVEYKGMTQIVFNCDSYKATYATDLAASITTGTVTVDGTVVTVTFDTPVDSLFIETLAAQVRVLSITAYGEGGDIGGGDEPVDPPVDPQPPVVGGVVENPQVGVAYKLGLEQTVKGATYYFTGKMSGFYGATETDSSLAVDMYLEAADGGYKLYFNANGAKQYICLVQSGTHYNFTFGADASIFTLDTEKNALCAPCGDQICYMGTYGNYVTIGTLTQEKLQDTDYLARLYEVGSGSSTPDVPVDPPVDPQPPVEGGTIIEFTDIANRVSYSTEEQVWAQNGITVTNNKAASTSNVGDYGGEGYPARFYKGSSLLVEYKGITEIVFNCDDYKTTYATDLAASITTGSVTVDGTVVTVTFDAPVDSLSIAELVAQVRVLSISVNGGGSSDSGDVGGDDPAIPDAENLSISDAIQVGLSQEHNVFTEQKYYVTGVITEVYNDVYGNMRLTDDAGNILTIYGSFSADGEIRYDALEVKPVAGDTVTVYGILGQYNGTPQMKNGWITAHIPGEAPVVPAPELSVEDAPVAGVAYKFGMVQGNVSADAVYYLAGGMSGYYMATSSSVASAIDVYLEETSGGYYLYAMVDGQKQYINMVVSGTHVNGAYEATASTVYTFDTDSYTLIAEIDGVPYWFGTRNDKTYTTVGPCATEYDGFYCQLYV